MFERRTPQRVAAAAFLVAGSLVVAPSALADSAGATVHSLPESEQLEVHAEVRHQCPGYLSEGEQCDWFASASAYSAASGCPSVFDASRGIWIGPTESTPGKSTGNFAFTPYGLESEIVVCLYVSAEGSSTLVGESHPFNRLTGREVLPAPKPPPERHRRHTRYPNGELCKPVKGAGGNVPGVWIMHIHRVHCPTARAVAKAVDRFTSPHHFTVHATHERWICSAEEVQGPEDPIGEVTCSRGGAIVVVGVGN